MALVILYTRQGKQKNGKQNGKVNAFVQAKKSTLL